LTGISGFIGAETCLQFLKDGGFRVRGTVRDKRNEAKVAPIREAFGEYFDQLELVEADLMDEQSLLTAIAGSTYVVHVASPFFDGSDPDKLITPAVNGTKYVMKACQATGVRRCVITSSCDSIDVCSSGCDCIDKTNRPPDRIYNESHWSNPDRSEGMHTYSKGKVIAEKAAWDF